MFVHFFSLHDNRDVHLAGLMEAKPEELCAIWPNRKDVPFYALQFCIQANFLSVQPLRLYEFFKNNVCSLFFLSTKIVMSTLRALWRLNQKSYVQFDHIEKMCHFTLYNFVFMQIFVGATVKALWFF